MKCCIIIPARLASTRLPNKILADIAGKPMIVRVYENALKANCGDVYVATDSTEVASLIGANTILTNPDLPSGTDRIYAALLELEKQGKHYDIIINVQGDVPNISPSVIYETKKLLEETKEADITTPITKIKDEAKKAKTNVVKAVVSFTGKALYFTRLPAPFSSPDLYEHIGLYAYKRDALVKFVSCPQSPLEKCESLEQLRALENNLTIYTKVVDFEPISVDVEEDLKIANKYFTLKTPNIN